LGGGTYWVEKNTIKKLINLLALRSLLKTNYQQNQSFLVDCGKGGVKIEKTEQE
jgi:hypothetical protein